MPPPLARRSWVEQIMGLPISLLARGDEATGAGSAAAAQAVFDELRGVDAVFSPYQPQSAISRVRRGEVGVDECGDDVREVAARCLLWRDLTGGLFDAVGPDGTWDPSGLVKGWAVERVARQLSEVGSVDWCLNAGGDVVVHSPSGEPFTIGIQDPADPREVVATLVCPGGGVATSGTAARGAHLYDPRSGRVVVGSWSSVTVAGPSLEVADVLATAAFVAGDGWTDVLMGFPTYEGLGVTRDGDLRPSAGWLGRPHRRPSR